MAYLCGDKSLVETLEMRAAHIREDGELILEKKFCAAVPFDPFFVKRPSSRIFELN